MSVVFSQSQVMANGPLLPDDRYLSRYASCIYWMSRYLKRAENLARLLEITQTFSPASRDVQNWESILTLYCDEDKFSERYSRVKAANVIRFYLTDRTHANSILSCLEAARVNASQLRAVISTEMWVQLNIMYNDFKALEDREISVRELYGVLSALRQQCRAFAGIAHIGLYRDQGWYFSLIGRDIERADQTTRLLDIKYHLLLPEAEQVGSQFDASQWFVLLRVAGGYHAFRRENPAVVSPASVAGFLLRDRRFPQSVAASVNEMGYALSKLYMHYGLTEAKELLSVCDAISDRLASQSIESIIGTGLHEYLDQLQRDLMGINDRLAQSFF